MRLNRIIILILLPCCAIAQRKMEVMEFTGKIISIEPGPSFALSRILIDVNGEAESFRFYPSYGRFFFEKIKPGDELTIRANVDIRTRATFNQLNEANKKLSWFFHSDILQVKINNRWIELVEPEKDMQRPKYKLFLEKRVVDKYGLMGIDKGIVFENGLVGFNYWNIKYLDNLKTISKGDLVSFMGYQMSYRDGYQYPIENVKEVFSLTLLNSEQTQLHSFLFKQNHVCIGVKFVSENGKELKLSFPSEEAQRVKKFLQPEQELRVYYGPEYNITKNDLPELHAIIQGRDTLRIEQFGFFGGADGEHKHMNVEVKGKISSVNKSDQGNVMSIIVGSEYYIEIDAMMAQQLGTYFKKGKEVVVAGKERVKKTGEIYNKEYRLITPEKLGIDGKFFELYHP